jgi:hypothetical protein
MEPFVKPSRRSRKTRQQIQDLLAEFSKSDCTVKEFCLLHHISQGTFHKWQSRHKNKTGKQVEPASFAALQITSSIASTNVALFAEVKEIKIYQPVAAAYLKELAS